MHVVGTDVALPSLNGAFADSRPLLVPAPHIVRRFLDAAVPLHQQVDNLDEMNGMPRDGRDLLLSRLMNGQLAV